MRRCRSTRCFASEIIQAARLVKVVLGVMIAGWVVSKGPFMTLVPDTGAKRLRDGGNRGDVQNPVSVSGQRGRPWSLTSVKAGTGTKRDISGTVAFDDGRRPASAGPRTPADDIQKWEAEGGDARVVTSRVARAESDGERVLKVAVSWQPEEAKEAEKKVAPRILTVLTTYNKRSSFVKAYKEAVRDRSDGYRPMIFVVSDEEDGDPEGVIDFRVGPPDMHRLLAAIQEACLRYEGQFDWLALGDDDTVFMYKRMEAFLSHIDHTQPVTIGRVDGLGPTALPGHDRRCFTPEQKVDTSDILASQGCCDDFTHPCKVTVYLEQPEAGHLYVFHDYGPGGLFWPFGGPGALVSAGLVKSVVNGTQGWARCAHVFANSCTDVQFAQCLKWNGYSTGAYHEGFTQMKTADPVIIRKAFAANCQVMGVHVGIRHLADGSNYTVESFKDAVAAVQAEDEAWTGTDGDLSGTCPEASEAIFKWS